MKTESRRANKSDANPRPGKRLFGDASWALLGQVGSGVLLLAGTRIITELVSPEVYGQVALLTGMVALGVSIFAYPFLCAGMRLLPECLDRGTGSHLYRAVARLSARSTALALVLLVAGGAVYSRATGSDPWPFAVSGLLLAATVRRELGIQLLIGERRQREASLWQTSDGILRPTLAVLAVLAGGAKAVLVLLGYALASATASTFWSMVRRVKRTEKRTHRSDKPAMARNLRREIWSYALPLIPMELLAWFSGLGDRYVIGYFMTAAEVGVYAAAYTLTNEAFNRSAMVLLRTFQPAYFQCYSTRQEMQAHRVLRMWLGCVILLGIAGVLALLLLKDWVAALLLAKTYHSAASLMPIIGTGCAIQALGMVMAQPLLAVKRTRAVLMARVFGAAAAAVSIPLMVREYGLMGAAMAAPVYFGLEALCMAILARPWRVTYAFANFSFPRSPWECRARRSALQIGPRSGQGGVPTQSVGTRRGESKWDFFLCK
jgi:O-antigen/teichoic acid export membrane protein